MLTRHPANPVNPPAICSMTKVTVRVGFGNLVRQAAGGVQELEVDAAPGESVLELKQKIAAAAGGAVTAEDLLLLFGPNDRKIGRQYAKDPTVDEAQLKLEQYSVLSWLERFPHWTLTGAAAQAAHGEGDSATCKSASFSLLAALSVSSCFTFKKLNKLSPMLACLQRGCCPPRRCPRVSPSRRLRQWRSRRTQTGRWQTRAPRQATYLPLPSTSGGTTMAEVVAPALGPLPPTTLLPACPQHPCPPTHPPTWRAGRHPQDQRPARPLGRQALHRPRRRDPHLLGLPASQVPRRLQPPQRPRRRCRLRPLLASSAASLPGMRAAQ